MARGIIYVMTTVVPGLIKIGKTDLNNFSNRMYGLERNGYSNVTGLSRRFAIEVEDYDEKEKLLDEIFSKSRVPNTELFALDIDLVIQLLSSFEGTQIYPEKETKEEVFKEATKEVYEKEGLRIIPDGTYYIDRAVKGYGKTRGELEVEDGVFTLKAGSKCAPLTYEYAPDQVKSASIVNGILTEDMVCSSLSTAAFIVIGKNANGWNEWKDKDGVPLNIFRNKKNG